MEVEVVIDEEMGWDWMELSTILGYGGWIINVCGWRMCGAVRWRGRCDWTVELGN